MKEQNKLSKLGEVRNSWIFLLHFFINYCILKYFLTLLYSLNYSNSQYYGYGIWLGNIADNTYIPYFQGCDPGVSFISSYDTVNNTGITAVSNFGNNVWKLRRNIFSIINK